jgi:cephalosporin-C deacetylase-like acetyl esterase
MKAFVVSALSAVALVGAPSAAVPPYGTLVHLYDYNAAAPLDVRETSVSTRDTVTIHELSFASPKGGRVTASLIVPRAAGRFPAVIVQPGLGGRREDAIPDAESLAERGAVTLAIDSPHTRPGGPALIRCRSRDRFPYIQYVVELRRAVDLLASRPEVDASRLGYTGFSYGATVGGTLSGVEHRIKAFVLQSGLPAHSRFLRTQCTRLSRARLAAYVRSMQVIDPIRYVGHAAPSALFFQNGTRDTLATRRQQQAYFRAASAPKTFRWYRAGHPLNPRARADRDAWLRARLGF